ncbi:MAG: Cna B-type domain-containing protein, partial [Erysipelotrichaceae bacterium]|nr:Cna B-type domain-containing protein [Erysipelotrichaceae bacterium]
TKADGWSWKWENLPKYENGKEIKYTVTEDVVVDYVTEVKGYDVINTYKPEKVTISGAKTWNDFDDQDGKRPVSITINLFANGTKIDSKTVTAKDGWKWSFSDLDKFDKDHKLINYTISEDVVKDYESEVKGYDVINTHKPELTKIEGTKTWKDNDNQDGKRPVAIIINLLKNGTKIDSKTVTAEDGWKWSWTNLEKYEKGKLINYTISEEVVEGYETEVKGYDVINTRKPETVSINGTKTWNDSDNQDGKRPVSITITLFADGTKMDSKTVTANEGWKWSWSDLPKYNKGKLISYTISEDVVTDYTTEIKGYDVINTHKPEVISIHGTKTWDDSDDKSGKRPVSITVNLFADGTKIDSKTVTKADGWKWSFTNLPKYNKGKEIKYTTTEEVVKGYITKQDGYDFINKITSVKVSKVDVTNQKELPGATIQIKDENGKVVEEWVSTDTPHEITGLEVGKTYTLHEVVAPLGYDIATDTTFIINPDGSVTTTGSKTEDGILLVEDALIPITINGTKTWNDNDDQDGKRPVSITIHLYADNTEVAKVTVTAKDGWKWSFTNLPEYKNGKKIEYTISEDVVKDYTTEIKGYDVVNTYSPDVVQVSGAKSWEDADNQDGKRPAEIRINLLADGKVIKFMKVTAKSGWKWNFTNLPKYKEGKEIKYSITEDVVEWYETEINGYNVKNTHVPETTEISGKKTWVDEDNKDGLRPESITVNLWKKVGSAEAVKVDSKKVTKEDNWSWRWTGLPKYEKGVEITYSVTEDVVKNYSTEVKGYDIVNTHTKETVDVLVKKIWDDKNNFYDLRPASITVHLF